MVVFDSKSDGTSVPFEYDVVVIGSGPAGATVARELASSGLRIAVVESGDFETTKDADALKRVISEGIAIKDYSRERVVGGASTTWAGLSSPLDPIDMEVREFVPNSGWPIPRDALLPYYERARRYRFAALSRFGPMGFATLRAASRIAPDWRGLDEKVFLACSDPQDFGREQRALYDRPDVDLHLVTTVTSITKVAGDASRAHSVRVVSQGGESREIRGRVFVLATGGIENARLLLLSKDFGDDGLGNAHDQVGRYLMNHPKNYYGILTLKDPVDSLPYFFGCMTEGYAGYAGLRLSEPEQRSRRVLNSYVRFEPLRSAFFFRNWKDRMQRKGLVELRDYSETGDDSALQNEKKSALAWLSLPFVILFDLRSVLWYLWYRVVARSKPRVKRVRLRNFMEMEPRPENRVLLASGANERDRFGNPLPLVRHQVSEQDKRSLIELHRVLRDEFVRTGVGSLDGDLETEPQWPIDQDASHHLGTTRMGRDPKTSVVDPNCRVHGVQNVFLAGGSVFPTSGCANPTFTIVALSIRLADHLKSDVFGIAAQPRREPSAAVATESSASKKTRVTIVGAGKRVVETAIPAFLAAAEHYEIRAVLGRSERPIEVDGHFFETKRLLDLEASDVEDTDLFYVAVGKGAVPSVLTALTRFDVGKKALLIDTPVLLWKHVRYLDLIDRFGSASVPEDCITLPWYDAVFEFARRRALGPVRSASFFRSAYKYHSVAMARAILGTNELVAARASRRDGSDGKDAIEGTVTRRYEFEDGRFVVVGEPRDYAVGSIQVEFASHGSKARFVSDRAEDRTTIDGKGERALLEPILDGEHCVGVRVEDVEMRLDPREASLMRILDPKRSVTARMEDWKRVGFLRLLRRLHAGEPGYSVLDGLDDALVDMHLERLGRYRRNPITSVKVASGRRCLSMLSRLLARNAAKD